MSFTDIVIREKYPQNVGLLDRVARLVGLPAVVTAWALGGLSTPWAIFLGVNAALLFKTGLTGKCIIYWAMNWSTKKS